MRRARVSVVVARTLFVLVSAWAGVVPLAGLEGVVDLAQQTEASAAVLVVRAGHAYRTEEGVSVIDTRVLQNCREPDDLSVPRDMTVRLSGLQADLAPGDPLLPEDQVSIVFLSRAESPSGLAAVVAPVLTLGAWPQMLSSRDPARCTVSAVIWEGLADIQPSTSDTCWVLARRLRLPIEAEVVASFLAGTGARSHLIGALLDALRDPPHQDQVDLADRLLAFPPEHRTGSVMLAAAWFLVDHPGTATPQQLNALARTRQPDMVLPALRAMAVAGDALFIPIIREYLASNDEQLQYAAVIAAAQATKTAGPGVEAFRQDRDLWRQTMERALQGSP